MPELDTLRGVAVLMVVVLHGLTAESATAEETLGSTAMRIVLLGGAGVNLFFVLSGFLITGILLDSAHRPDYLRRFYLRRALRIAPALFVTLVVLLALGVVSGPFFCLTMVGLANFAPVFGVFPRYGVFWSLAVEEHFYLFWPRAVRRLSRSALAGLLVAIVLLTPTARVVRNVLDPNRGDLSDFYTWFNLDGLALGGLVALWLRWPGFRRRHLARGVVAALAIGSAAFLLNGRWWLMPMGVEESFGNLIFAGLVGGSLIVGTGPWRRLVERRFLGFCGFISYGLYLVHPLVFRLTWSLLSPLWVALRTGVGQGASLLAGFTCGTGAAIGVAWVSRRTLEAFFLGLGYAHAATDANAPLVAEAAALPWS